MKITINPKINVKNLKYLTLIFLMLLVGCEDVIDLDLKTGEPQLVIDAEILWQKGTDGNIQTIKVSRITDYYNPVTTIVSGAQVYVENSAGNLFAFNESDNLGEYRCIDFIPNLNESYTLYVTVENETYTASETLIPVPEINRIEQKYIQDFSEKVIEVSFFYNDPEAETNYYLSDFRCEILQYPEYILTSDDFYNGNEIEDSFSDEDLTPGDILEITHRGVSEKFYNYMNLVLETIDGNPFATPPANIRGNIVNQDKPDNYALGFFRVCEVNYLLYTVEEIN